MGSSRDWAAKGVALLNVRAVLAVGFERIHRANLVDMGVLPLRLPPAVTPATLALQSGDRVEVNAAGTLGPRATVPVTVHRKSGETQTFETIAAVETSLEAAPAASSLTSFPARLSTPHPAPSRAETP